MNVRDPNTKEQKQKENFFFKKKKVKERDPIANINQ